MEITPTDTGITRAAGSPGEAAGRASTTTLLTRHEGGYAAQGPGFFVWDRDPAEVIRVAEALQAGRFAGSRTARFLVIEAAEPLDARARA